MLYFSANLFFCLTTRLIILDLYVLQQKNSTHTHTRSGFKMLFVMPKTHSPANNLDRFVDFSLLLVVVVVFSFYPPLGCFVGCRSSLKISGWFSICCSHIHTYNNSLFHSPCSLPIALKHQHISFGSASFRLVYNNFSSFCMACSREFVECKQGE